MDKEDFENYDLENTSTESEINKESESKFFGGGTSRIVILAIVLVVLLALVAVIFAFALNSKSTSASDELEKDKLKTEKSTTTLEELDAKDELHVEVGILELDINEFFNEDVSDKDVYFVGDLSKIDLSKIGVYPVKIQYGDRIYEIDLVVEDTLDPVVEFKDLMLPTGSEYKAEDFVVKAEDATKLSYDIQGDIDPKSTKAQTLKIKVTDEGGNSVEAEVKLTFVPLKPSITVEAGSVNDLSAEDFFLIEGSDKVFTLKTDLGSIRFNVVDKIPVVFEYKGKEVRSHIIIEDTVAPTAQAQKVVTYLSVMPSADEFVTNIVDATDVSVSFVTQPNVSRVGSFEVAVELEDMGGNTTRVNSTMEVKRDETAPVIYGANNFTYYPGERNLLAGVSVSDDLDPNPSLTVDKSKVDETERGTYPLTYIAKDKAGNVTRKTVQVTVKLRIPYEPKGNTGSAQLNQYADSILRNIINGEMSQYEQAYQIFLWLGDNLSYRAQSNRTNLVAGAITGLTQRSGDCYIFKFTNQALLTRAGISNYGTNSDTGSHAWAMVTIGGRSFISDPLWSYFDVPLSVVRERLNAFESGYFNNTQHHTRMVMETEEKSVAFEIEQKANPNQFVGYRKTIQEGKDGIKQVMYQVTYVDGKETDRKYVSETTIRPAVKEIVEVGTKVKQAPEITWTGPDTLSIELGENIDFTADVSAIDPNTNTELKVEVSVPAMDEAGTYTVTYKATNSEGMSASKNRKVLVEEPVSTPTTSTTTEDETTTTTTESTTTTQESITSDTTSQTTTGENTSTQKTTESTSTTTAETAGTTTRATAGSEN